MISVCATRRPPTALRPASRRACEEPRHGTVFRVNGDSVCRGLTRRRWLVGLRSSTGEGKPYAFSGVVGVLMLPHPDRVPAQGSQPRFRLGVTTHVARKLRHTVGAIHPWRARVVVTAVPETTVDEDGNAGAGERDVDAESFRSSTRPVSSRSLAGNQDRSVVRTIATWRTGSSRAIRSDSM